MLEIIFCVTLARATFHDMWMRGKEGWSIDRLKRELNVEDYAFNRKYLT